MVGEKEIEDKMEMKEEEESTLYCKGRANDQITLDASVSERTEED